MSPVLILQHLSADDPAYLGTWLRANGVPFTVRNTEAGEVFPERIDGFSALAILGGEMSANDPLPSLRRAEALFLQALERGVPTLGHCLGGQLMARALGATVDGSPAPEIGWQPVTLVAAAAARDWFGDATEQVVFQWHHEAFALPPGAQALATSAACPQQAFAIGPHLAMQFHVEVDAAKIARWTAAHDPHEGAAGVIPDTVQSAAQMREGVASRLAMHQSLADRIYRRWLSQR